MGVVTRLACLALVAKLARTLAVCAIALASVICANPIRSSLDEDQKRLTENRAKWVSKRINDYRYKFEWRCFCAPDHVAPVVISVRQRAIRSIKYAKDNTAVGESKYSRYQTIDGLFDLIQDGITRKAYRILVSYDSDLGYPTAAFIDYSAQTADEENGFKVEELATLP